MAIETIYVKINDKEKLYKALDALQINLLKILEGLDSSEETEKLKVGIKQCKVAEQLMQYANQVLRLVLDA